MRASMVILAATLAWFGSPASAGPNPGLDAPVLQWSSSQEEGVYGYIIYRAVDPEGPFLRINSRIIPRDKEWDVKDAGQDKKKSNYRYVDDSADSTVTNYYYIDAIGESGRKKRLTDVVSKSPKPPGQQN